MEFNEHTLLNRPALMLTVLKTAARGPADRGDCLEALKGELAAVHETMPVAEQEVLAELDIVVQALSAAALLASAGGDRFTLTRRGHEVLAAHPMGVDDTVLVQFPEYRAFVRRFARHGRRDDPRTPKYDEGLAAYQAGLSLTDNPYQADTIDHLAWENGWSEARDEDLDTSRR